MIEWQPSPITSLQYVALAVMIAFASAGFSQPVAAAPGAFRECVGELLETPGLGRVSFQDLADRATKADYIAFGERHGVKEQAVASACVLSALNETERPVALVMEMLASDDDATVARYRDDNPETAAGLGVTLKWWTRGWPAFDNWLPLIERAFSLRIPVTGGDLPAGNKNQARPTKKEKNRLQARLGPAHSAIRESWKRTMVYAHCGLISDEQAAMNADEQIRRDLSMADAARKAAAPGKRVLMQVGRGHSRKDRALFAALSHSGAAVLAIGAFAEGETVTDDDRKLYDFIWITGKTDLKDPCALVGTSSRSGEQPVR